VNGTPSPTIVGASEICAGTSGVVYTTEAGFSNYLWTISFGGTITSRLNTNEITVTWASAGSRSISVNYENALGCDATTPTNYAVTVFTVPVPQISGENEVCEGTTGVAYSTEPNNENYVWVVSAGGIITSGAGTNAITVNWIGNGNQTVSVDYTNSQGCEAIEPTVYNVSVNQQPAAAGVVTGTTPICAGTTGVIYSVLSIANATSYVWTVPPGATIVSGAETNSITVDFVSTASSGVIKVYGSNDCGNGISSPDFNLVVNPIPPTPVITQNGNTLTSSANTGNQWYDENGFIAGATDPIYIPDHDGSFYVIVTINGCSSEPSNVIQILNVSIPDLEKTIVNVYPNPNTGVFWIEYSNSGSQKLLQIQIIDALGKTVYAKAPSSISIHSKDLIDLNSIPNGTYTILLLTDKKQISHQIVIRN
jgi:hypothetical protein